MENLRRLPKAYYKYENVVLSEADREIKDKVVITISLYLACKIEKYCYQEGWTNQRLLKQMLLNSKILNDDDLDIKDTARNKFEFEDIEADSLKNVKASKQINIYFSKYAKDKLYKELLEKGYEIVFLIKKELIKAGIITMEDLSY